MVPSNELQTHVSHDRCRRFNSIYCLRTNPQDRSDEKLPSAARASP